MSKPSALYGRPCGKREHVVVLGPRLPERDHDGRQVSATELLQESRPAPTQMEG
jgi:hypothetical protein